MKKEKKILTLWTAQSSQSSKVMPSVLPIILILRIITWLEDDIIIAELLMVTVFPFPK